MKSLVVYYSRSGNTRFVAEKISQEIGGDIEEIIDKKRRNGLVGFVLSGYDATRGRITEIAEIRNLQKTTILLLWEPQCGTRELRPL